MEKENKWDRSHLWPEELDLLKSIVNKTGLVETIKWGAPVYTYKGKNVLGLIGLKNYFALWFYKGVFLKDEAGVLVSADDNTKSLRQWRFSSKADINEKLLLQYIKEAIVVEEAGLAIKPEKKEVVIPELLQQELHNNSALAAEFTKFSPYKQKEYCEYIETAKQEKTKLSRLEKIKPMILEGKGLNDKYK
jgi:uncharacterized protein YdeI (YjbR/CyaY-like superfamily)